MMKRYSLLLTLTAGLCATLFLLPGCGRADLDAAAKFQEAQKIFDSAQKPDDYLKAAGVYRSILDRGTVSGAVLYNLGNAMMKAGHRGEAIAAYREAQRYLPGDPYLAANLQYARGELAPETTRPMLEHLMFWQNRIAYPTKVYLTFGLGLVAFALGLVALFTTPRFWNYAAITTVVVTVVFAFSAAYDWYRFDLTRHGVITADEVVARKGNADSYEPAFTEPLADGTEFTVVEPRGNWLLIRLPGEKEGWVPKSETTLF